MTNNLTLLYVEDDTIIRENFIEIFKAYFGNVISTDNGNKALELYENNKIDVAILDISINGINGLSVAEKIREKDAKTVILMISAHSEKEKLLKAVNLHLFGYLVKPVSHKDLIEYMEKITSKLLKDSLTYLSNDYFWNDSKNTLFYKERLFKLTKNETRVIKILIKNKNMYLNACEIQNKLFKETSKDDTNCNNVVQLISRLKKKITDLTNTEDYFIENCYGTGYKIVISPQS